MDQQNQIQFNVIETIKIVAEALEDSRLEGEKLQKITPQIEILNTYFSTSSKLTLLLVGTFMRQLNNYSVTLSCLIDYFGMDKIQVVEIKRDIDELMKLRLLESDEIERYKKRKLKISRFNFEIAGHIVNAIYDNISIEDSKKSGSLDIFQFCAEVSALIEARSNYLFSYVEMENEVLQMEDNNLQIPIITHMINQNISPEDRILIYEMFDDLVEGDSGTNLQITLKDMFDEKKKIMRLMSDFKSEKSDLLKKNYITLSKSKYSNDIVVKLTDNIMELMAGENLNLLFTNNSQKNLLKPENIQFKELFFAPALNDQINFLQNSLLPDKFDLLQNRLSSNAMTKGVAAVFYGSPGTGKTESAMQIAKITGRDVLTVDISSTKSMWFGESEKLIKDVFDKYRMICASSKQKPILLFNEADAILSKRKTAQNSSVDQTENAIQNILLEEMERLDGIMIATTNLVGNLDAAFERRFLFKINFSKPSNEIKSKIWQSKVSYLSNKEADVLSEKFEFSGGEIDNIVKKILMEEVLKGEKPGFDQILQFCLNERFLTSDARSRVGFN